MFYVVLSKVSGSADKSSAPETDCNFLCKNVCIVYFIIFSRLIQSLFSKIAKETRLRTRAEPHSRLRIYFIAVILKFAQSGRKKIFHRELNLFKHFARVAGGIFAFFIRDTEIICRNHHLHLALKLHNGKQPQGDVNLFADRNILEAAAHLGANLARCRTLWL